MDETEKKRVMEDDYEAVKSGEYYREPWEYYDLPNTEDE